MYPHHLHNSDRPCPVTGVKAGFPQRVEVILLHEELRHDIEADLTAIERQRKLETPILASDGKDDYRLARNIDTAVNKVVKRCTAYLMGVSAVLALSLRFASGTMVSCALVLGLCCSATYGINPMLTTIIPMEYERAGRVGLVAGMSDCFIYLGSSLAGVVTGAISDAAGWPVVFVMWCAVALMSMAFAFLSMRGGKRLESMED